MVAGGRIRSLDEQWMVGWTALAYQQYITYLSARENEDQESKKNLLPLDLELH